jgi:hypothetical protein
MRALQTAAAALFCALFVTASARAEVLIRWDRDRIPSPDSLGISTVVVPAANRAALDSAFAQGYRVFLEVDGAAVPGFVAPVQRFAGVVVKGKVAPKQLQLLRERMKPRGARVVALEERGKWPHIRTNWVTKNNEVLQVTGRSSQPWIENNAALMRIADADEDALPPLLTYTWTPITLSDKDEGPRLENYLVAIAEAGSFGGDLLLPLHERFESRLLMGQPQARAEWAEIRRYVAFYSWSLPQPYRPIASIGVVTAEPVLWFEVMNLLGRHNLPYELIAPSKLASRRLDDLKVLIVLDELPAAQQKILAEFESKGGTVHRVKGAVGDPNVFALKVRQMLGPDRRPIDIWNGITVLAAPYEDPNGGAVLVTVLNYAHQELPVQLRIRGTFAQVHYESPEEGASLVPHQQRNGFTEFVLPALRVGGRVFLTR